MLGGREEEKQSANERTNQPTIADKHIQVKSPPTRVIHTIFLSGFTTSFIHSLYITNKQQSSAQSTHFVKRRKVPNSKHKTRWLQLQLLYVPLPSNLRSMDFPFTRILSSIPVLSLSPGILFFSIIVRIQLLGCSVMCNSVFESMF